MEIRRRALTVVAASWICILVWLLHRPIDSVLLRQGNGLPLAIVSMVLAAITLAFFAPRRGDSFDLIATLRRRDFWIDVIPWLIVGWVTLSAWVNRWPSGEDATRFVGNHDYTVAHIWWMVTAACVWTSARRVGNAASWRVLIWVMVAGGISLSVRAIEQHWIEIPNLIAQYDRDPDAMIAAVGIEAPAGSSRRMVFENRLRDGGASASFALANSLAAVLVMSLLICISLTTGLNLPFTIVAIVMMAIALWITHSRSAVGAAILGCLALAGLVLGSKFADTIPSWVSQKKRWIGVGLAIALLGFALAIASFRTDSEWVEMAPASAQTRIDYWRATIAMVADHPWFGIGPGNFQAAYSIYRLPQTSENIADPHHFWFETLAMGGIPAALLLTAWLAMLAMRFVATTNRVQHAGDALVANSWVWWGSGVGLATVWLYGFSTLQLEVVTFAADAVAVAWLTVMVRRKRFDFGDRGVVIGAAVAAVCCLLHLSFSGGWSVPGIALPWWLLMAVLFPAPMLSTVKATSPFQFDPSKLFMSSVLIIVAICVTLFVYLPSRQSAALRDQADYSFRSGHRTAAQRTVAMLTRDYPSRVDATLWAAAITSQQTDSASLERWQSLIDQARRFGGTSATIERQIVDQSIAAYQSSGNAKWLSLSSDAADRLVGLSPNDVSNIAAAAVVHAAAGESKSATTQARWATALASLTDNPERALSRQMILVPATGQRLESFAKRIGVPFADQPISADAESQFEFFGLTSVEK